jgi:hypothetical protein
LGVWVWDRYESAQAFDDERQNDPDDKSRSKISELVITRASHRYGQHHGHRVADDEPSDPWHALGDYATLDFNHIPNVWR